MDLSVGRLALISLLALSIAASENAGQASIGCSYPSGAGESVSLHGVTETPQAPRQYSDIERQRIEDLKKQIVTFWKGSFEKRYRMLTDKYRRQLSQANIKTAADLGEIFDKESYSCLLFRSVDYGKLRDTEGAEVKMDVIWHLEGYSGVQTFIFLVKWEQNEWKIASIIN